MKGPTLRAFAGQALLERLQRMLKESRGVRLGEDPECLHRMRVASRRLRSALSLFESLFEGKETRRWRREVGGMARALGDGRDLDVQIQYLETYIADCGDRGLRPGPERLLLRLRQRREGLQRTIVSSLDAFFDGPTPSAMAEAFRGLLERDFLCGAPKEDDLGDRVAEALFPLLARLLSFSGSARCPEDVEGLHSMRIAAKRLRYAVEIFLPHLGEGGEPLLDEARSLQALLGRIHDDDVWIAFLPDFIDEERRRTVAFYGHGRLFPRLLPGLEALERAVAADRTRTYEAFLDRWEELEERGFWSDRIGAYRTEGEVERHESDPDQ